jgi:hypothetical protein
MKPNIQHFTHCYGIDINKDGRSGIAICYGYARGVSIPCDKCRKERKYHCKCNDREYLRSAATVEKEQ